MNDIQYREVPLATVSALSGADIATLRTWIARNPTPYRGQKRGRNLYFSLREVYFYCLLRRLVEYGTSIATAMEPAQQVVDDTPADGPAPDATIVFVHLRGMLARYDRNDLLDEHWPLAAAHLQLGKLWRHIVKSVHGEDRAAPRPRRKRAA